MIIQTTVNLGYRSVAASAVIVGNPINHIMADVHIRHPNGSHDIDVTPAEYQAVSEALFNACAQQAAGAAA